MVVSCLLACILVWYKYCYYTGVPVFIVVISFAGRVAYLHHRARSVELLRTVCIGSIGCRDLYSDNYIRQGQHLLYHQLVDTCKLDSVWVRRVLAPVARLSFGNSVPHHAHCPVCS